MGRAANNVVDDQRNWLSTGRVDTPTKIAAKKIQWPGVGDTRVWPLNAPKRWESTG